MNANEREFLNSIAERVVGAAYEVSNTLGAGFLEKVYERALAAKCRQRAIRAISQAPVAVLYKCEQVGEYFADLLVDDVLIVELKCAAALSDDHLAQCLNYSRATGLHLALLLNFQRPKVEWKRVVRDF